MNILVRLPIPLCASCSAVALAIDATAASNQKGIRMIGGTGRSIEPRPVLTHFVGASAGFVAACVLKWTPRSFYFLRS
jgi:hypothetical protein